MRMNSIKMKLTAAMVAIVVFSLLIVSGVSYYYASQALGKSTNETALAISSDYAMRIQAVVRENTMRLQDGAGDARLYNPDRQVVQATIVEIQKRIGQFDSIRFAWPDGSSISNTGNSAAVNSSEYFKVVSETKKLYISDPSIARSTGKLAILIAVPVINNGQFTGVMVAAYSLDKLDPLVKTVKFMEHGYAFLTDDNGLTIAHAQRPELSGKLKLDASDVDPALKLPEKKIDAKLVEMINATAKKGETTSGDYVFGGQRQLTVTSPIELMEGQRWVLAVTTSYEEATAATRSIAQTMLVLSILFLVLAIVISILYGIRFTKPIIRLAEAAKLVAGGNLKKTNSDIRSKDEIGDLARSFQQLTDNLREIVGKVQEKTEQVAASSEELTANAGQSAQVSTQVATAITSVAEGTTRQVSSIEQAARAVGHISQSIQSVAATSNNVAAQAEKTANVTAEGGKAVDAAVTQMSNIAQGSQQVQESVNALAHSSEQIRNIVNVIANIASQTNLLALNAAIEAARAGEAGRGFAVVAEEVRKLAEQSQDAAKQIAELISANTDSIGKAVSAMETGARDVVSGIEIVNIAGKNFKQIAELVNNMTGSVREISVAMGQMKSGGEEIVGAVNNIGEVSKQTAAQTQTVSAATEEQSAAMEEISASSEALSKLAEELQEAVSKFKL
ncbi:MAG: methyl-accepting chemotaxis protein [Negativicutes bacterium]